MAGHPNIIVIVSDTFRPDHIGANGGRALTPEIDEFMKGSVTFDKALASSFPTIPMRTDWFTGRFSHPRHGWQDLDRSAITLPQILGKNGYTTQFIADTTHMLRAKFWEPFQHFSFRRGHEGDVPFSRLNESPTHTVSDRKKIRVDYPGQEFTPADIQPHTNHTIQYEDQAHSTVLADDICRWIEGNWKASPFFLWVDFFDVHEPWFPPEYLWRYYQPEYDGEPMVQPNYMNADAYSPDELENLRARYAAQCTMLSKNVGRVFRMIEDTRLIENTIVVFLSDHGHYLGEHNITGKSFINENVFDVAPFHPEVSRICWTMSAPESVGAKRPDSIGRSNALAQAADLVPTLLDLAGIEHPEPGYVEGESLAPIMRGERDGIDRDVSITAWSIPTHHERKMLHSRRPSIYDGEWTLMLFDPPDPAPPELYHSAADPSHDRNVVGEHPVEAKRLHEAFMTWMRKHDANDATLERFSAENVGLV